MKTIIESYQAGLFQKKYWIMNLVSGVIVGVVATGYGFCNSIRR
ncbi:MAG TPA: hypothetical protein PK657_12415 [Legionella sp.]|nr:hypothetical protein [Legionella sp.]